MLHKCRLGQTSLEVSLIGLGTVKFGRTEGLKYPNSFSLPSDQDLSHLLALASELGINLLDTAPAYGISEERLGKLLKKKRKQWVITTKVGEEFIDGQAYFDFSPKTISQSVERSLKRLKTDYLDVVLIHSNGEDKDIIEKESVFLTLETLKNAGKLRAYGMSTKTVAGGLLAVEKADVVMLTLYPGYIDEQEVISYAHQQQKGVFIKKALGSGHIQPEIALPFVLAEPGVTSVIIGTINPSHLQRNVETAVQFFAGKPSIVNKS